MQENGFDNIFLLTHYALWYEDSPDLGVNASYGKNNWFSRVHPLIKEKVKYVFSGDGSRIIKLKRQGVNYITLGFPLSKNELGGCLLVKIYNGKIELEEMIVEQKNNKSFFGKINFLIQRIYEKFF